jgi:uncharacterized membrane protein
MLPLVLVWMSERGQASAKDYSVPLVVIDATVRADGTILYEEHRTYRFDGSFSEADYRLSRAGFDEIRDIHVREGAEPFELRRSRDAGTYRVDEGRRTVDITWYYRATDEDRTFTVSYVLVGAIPKGEEAAEFFWTYLSDRWDRGTDSLVVNLAFPGGHPPEGLHTFLRGASDQVDIVPTAEGVRITGSGFRSSQSLAARIVFPASLIPDAPITHPELTVAGVLEEEEQRRLDAIERRAAEERRAGRWTIIGLIAGFVSLLTFVGIFRRYSVRPTLSEKVPVEVYAPPADRRPALAGALLPFLTVSSHSLVATLFDLCRRGYYRLIEQEPEKRRFQPDRVDYRIEQGSAPPDPSELTWWEKEVVDLVDTRLAAGETTVREVFDFQKGTYQKWFTKWQTGVQKEVAAVGWYEPRSSRAITLNVLGQLPILGISILTFVFAGPVGSFPFSASLFMLAGSGLLRVRTEAGEREYRLWKAYRDVLAKGNLENLSSNISLHFPYAVAMYVTGKRLEALVTESRPDDFDWLVATNGLMISPARLTQSISTVTTSVGSTISAGTGASVGAAGGGAGGGAR